MRFLGFCRAVLVLVALGLVSAPAASASSADSRRADIRKMRDDVLRDLYQLKPEVKEKIGGAAGYAVFSNVGINIIFASFAGGKGIVVRKGLFRDSETFMKMGSAGVGLGLGVKDFRAVFIFYDKRKLDDFVEHGWDFSGQADAAAKSDDKGGAVATAGTILPGVEIYQLTKNGLALQATLQGTKYWKDRSLD